MSSSIEVLITGHQLLQLNIDLERLQQWIIPGRLSLRFALVQISLEDSLKALQKETEKLQNQHALLENVPGTSEQRKVVKPIMAPGTEQVIAQEIIMKDRAAFDAVYQELLSLEMTVRLPHLLTVADFEQVEKDMLEDVSKLIPPRLTSFAPVMETTCRPAISPNGTSRTTLEKPVGVHRRR